MDWLRQATRELHGWRVRNEKKVISLPGMTARAAAEEDSSFRRYQEGDIWVPKKNSKTLWLACTALGSLLLDGEKGAEAYIIASDEEQARVGFEMAQSQITFKRKDGGENPLADFFTAWEDRIELTEDPDNTWFKVIAGSPGGKMGPNVHFVAADEIHQIPDPTAIKHLKKGMIARQNPLFMQTSHFGEKMDGYGYRQYLKTIAILDGKVKRDRVMTVVYEFPEHLREQWRDPSLWHIPNPAYGISINPDRMLEEFHDIEDKTDENNFKIYYLNIWCGTDESLPFDMAEWDACREDFTLEDLYKSQCAYVFGGIDLGSSDDMTADVILTVTRETDDKIIYRVLPEYYLPNATLADAKKKALYTPWVESGELRITDGAITEYGVVRQRVKEHKNNFPKNKFQVVGMDRNMANETSTNMTNLDGFEVIHIPQTFTALCGGTKRLGELVKTRELRHNGHAVLRWNVENARIIKDNADRGMLSKKKSKGKIDGLAATVFALSRAIIAPPPPKVSVYAGRGLR